MFNFDRLRELGRFIDDMEAVKADLASGDVNLQAHGLERLADLAREGADKFDQVPGMARGAAFMRSCAEDALAQRDELVEANNRRVQFLVAEFNKGWDRIQREDDKRREELRIEAENGEQPDMFGNFTLTGRPPLQQEQTGET